MSNLKLKNVINICLYFGSALIFSYTILYTLNVERLNKTKSEHFWSTLTQSLGSTEEVKQIDVMAWNLNDTVEHSIKEVVPKKNALDYVLLAVFIDGEKSRVLLKDDGSAKWFFIGSRIEDFIIESVNLYKVTLRASNGERHFLEINSKNNEKALKSGNSGSESKSGIGSDTKKDAELTKALIDLGKVKPPSSLPPLPQGFP